MKKLKSTLTLLVITTTLLYNPTRAQQNVNDISNLFPFEKDGKWGLENVATKKQLTPAKYPYIDVGYWSEGLLRVEDTQKKYGFIDSTGKEVIPPMYEGASEFFHDGLVAVKKNNQWGFIDRTGKIVIPFQYEEAYLFYDGLACVKDKGKFGFINNKGKEVIPFQYDYAGNFIRGLAEASKNDKYGFINTKGQTVIPFIYDIADPFNEGVAKVAAYNGSKIKYGFIDTKGNVIAPLIYEQADDFVLANKYDNKEQQVYIALVQKGGKWGYIDKTGKEIVPTIYDEGYRFSGGDGALIKDGKKFVFNHKGECIEGCK